MKRRDFLKLGAMAGGMTVLRPRFGWAFQQSPTRIRKFIVPLPGLGPRGIPVAAPDATNPYPNADYYRFTVGAYTQQLHPDLPGPTHLFGYADVSNGQAPNHRYLGGVIVAKKDRPVRATFTNNLPATHILPVDPTVPGGAGQPETAIVTHLHGGHTPWVSDGTPFQWFDQSGNTGPSFASVPDMPPPAAGSCHFFYPNDQTSRLMWYHDHAMSTTRLNAYAGIASAYVLTDDYEQSLIAHRILPGVGIPLVIQDKSFIGPNGNTQPNGRGGPGDLWYPSVYEATDSDGTPGSGRWEQEPFGTALPAGPSVIPEFFGDTMLVNGAPYPYCVVEPRHYRFRILNASQARFLNLQLYLADATGQEADLRRRGPAMLQIGTEGGFLPRPVLLNKPPQRMGFDGNGNPVSYTLLLAPGERADVIINFAGLPVGTNLILYSDAPAPFPSGDDRNDYYTGDPDFTAIGGAPTTKPYRGPNTRTIMRFQVRSLVGLPDPAARRYLYSLAVPGNLPPAVAGVEPPQVERLRPVSGAALVARDLTLNEDFDEYGRLIQKLGTAVQNGTSPQSGDPVWGRNYTDAPTETPKAGDTEIWRIFNLTGDTHPIHFHLVNVQIISRQPFDAGAWDGSPTFTGPMRPPDPNEEGWKETVRMNPGECTTVIAQFNLPATPFAMPVSPRTGGHEYVWHCHILEHEEHDMMRPLIVQP
jgi:spore coat protein A